MGTLIVRHDHNGILSSTAFWRLGFRSAWIPRYLQRSSSGRAIHTDHSILGDLQFSDRLALTELF